MVDPLPEAMRLRLFRLILWSLVAVAATVLLALWLHDQRGAQPDPTTYAASVGGPFALTAADGSRVTDQTLAGRPYAIFFGFTRCPDVCPTTLSRLAQLRKKMGADGDKLKIVFVSVDPESDMPADVGNYVALFNTPILGLAGTQDEIARTAEAYKVTVKKVPLENGGYTVGHTASVLLFDADNRLASTIDAHESDATALAKLKRLVA